MSRSRTRAGARQVRAGPERPALGAAQKGAIAEAAVAAAAIELGFTVLRPLIEGRRYDLVIDTGRAFVRAQCKWAPRKSEVVVVSTRTCRHTPGGYVRTTYRTGEVDGIAAYCPQERSVFWLPIARCRGRRSCISGSRLRATASRGG